ILHCWARLLALAVGVRAHGPATATRRRGSADYFLGGILIYRDGRVDRVISRRDSSFVGLR
ncbi:hypothetical protein, partial [Roseimicrobium gellanilyticum]|uniref:hypothetical protein n=1 Tax=Roseimicrobium gellanilyticum TaxID=748857 RepID=UPI001B875DD1